MNFGQRALRQPQNIWLRRALFQIHLWTGIAAGVYLILISVSGSALVFRVELHRRFDRTPVIVAPSGAHLTEQQIKEAAQKAFPRYSVSNVWPTKNPNQAVEVWFDDHGMVLQRIFHPYTGADLGPSEPAGVRIVLWLADLHDNLLYGEKGRTVNGIGALLLTALCITGAVIWWPGLGKLRRSLALDLTANWKRINWSMHSAVGFWTFLLVLLWAISGVYLVWSEPFAAVVDYLQPLGEDALPGGRLGDDVLSWLAKLHFGRFGGWPIKAVWVALGLVPAVLFVTGALMWWNRVLRPAMRLEYDRTQRISTGVME